MTTISPYERETARQKKRPDVPPGHIPAHRWYLQKNVQDKFDLPQAPSKSLTLRHEEHPSVELYRKLYNNVGGPWLWGDRRRLNDDALQKLISPEQVEIFGLYVEDEIAGFFELDLMDPQEVELCYFGLMPAFTGRKLGPYLLGRAIQQGAQRGCTHMNVNTCTLDHPRALALYERMGFAIIKELDYLTLDPRLDGTIEKEAAPHIPLAKTKSENNT